ncbi:MAG: aldehyde dehydrogenase EutE, partial [Planctomycetaceae bacterium]|nr:aldehyde dehydrogenase EutE [Planctomycetaceae bacterium]
MQINETMIRNVVSQVLAEVVVPGAVNSSLPTNGTHKYGVFYDANEAVAAAHVAFEQLR